jgi:hypothetical protein
MGQDFACVACEFTEQVILYGCEMDLAATRAYGAVGKID